jgi:glycosyltransferase involved in cell wall biosynthesis
LIAPSFAAQFSVSADEHTFCTTNADVISEIDARGRPRIKAPFQLFGHVVCDEPERIGGLFWCLDLLKSGYVFGHVPTSFGAYRVIFPWLIVRHLLSRCGWPPISLAGPNRLSAALSRVTKPRKPTYEPEPGRVLMMTEDLGRGGSERQLVAATAGLLRRDCDVKMFLLKRLGLGEPNYEDDVVRLGIAPEYASDTVRPARICMRHRPDGLSPADCAALPPWLSDGVLKAAEAIARHRPTVVHGWLDRPGIVAALAACAAGVPRIVIQIGSMAISRRNGMASELLRQAYKALARNPSVTIVNNSAAGARDNEKWIGLKPQSIGVLHNGFLPETARRPSPDDTARYRESLGLSAGLVVGTVMRFVPEKDPDLWLDTAAEIAKVRPDVRFLIAGFGALERSIKARIDTLGLTDRVALVGPVTDSGLAYSAMDVVLLSSAIEGTPNVVIEAQAVGCPVVATDVGGTSEALVEGRTGLIARPRSAASLAKAVITILGDVEWQNRVRTEGPDFVSRRFGFERMIDETLRHYGFETPLPASRLRAHSS